MSERERHIRPSRLIEVAPLPQRETWNGSQELVAIDPDTCPACGNSTHEPHQWLQPALFYFGGYGGMTSTIRRSCSACPWSLIVEVGTRSPR